MVCVIKTFNLNYSMRMELRKLLYCRNVWTPVALAQWHLQSLLFAVFVPICMKCLLQRILVYRLCLAWKQIYTHMKPSETISIFMPKTQQFSAYSKYRFAMIATNSPIRSSFNGLSSACNAITKSFSFGEWKTINWSRPGLTLIPSNCENERCAQKWRQ